MRLMGPTMMMEGFARGIPTTSSELHRLTTEIRFALFQEGMTIHEARDAFLPFLSVDVYIVFRCI